jgi:hypothetical protein
MEKQYFESFNSLESLTEESNRSICESSDSREHSDNSDSQSDNYAKNVTEEEKETKMNLIDEISLEKLNYDNIDDLMNELNPRAQILGFKILSNQI